MDEIRFQVYVADADKLDEEIEWNLQRRVDELGEDREAWRIAQTVSRKVGDFTVADVLAQKVSVHG